MQFDAGRHHFVRVVECVQMHEIRAGCKITMDQGTQFRTAVRTVLTILMEDDCDPADRVRRAIEILLRLPVPMPSVERTRQYAPDQDTTLYIAGSDGLPTSTRYDSSSDEGALTEEEVTIMLREQRGA